MQHINSGREAGESTSNWERTAILSVDKFVTLKSNHDLPQSSPLLLLYLGAGSLLYN